MIDEPYGCSADMRMHDLQRGELGMPPRPPVLTSYIDADVAANDVEEDEDDEAYAASGTVLVAALNAQPRSALIPGALVTIVLTVVNDGSVTARNVQAILARPADTTYRAGTFSIDGKTGSDDRANELFENGTDIGDIAPRGRRTMLLKLVIEAGLGDIALSPHLSAAAGAVLGLRAMLLKRAEPSSPNVVPERPFYELNPEELALEELAAPPKLPTITVLQPVEFSPIVIAVRATGPASLTERAELGPTMILPATREAESKHRAIASVKAEAVPVQDGPDLAALAVEKRPAAIAEAAAEPTPTPRTGTQPRIESVRSVEDEIFVIGRGGPILTVRLDRKRLATLNRLFSGPSLGMIAHYLVLNALAATDALPGDGTDGSIAAFAAHQEQLLSRALIATRLGKNPAPDSVSAPLPPFPPRISVHVERRQIDTPDPRAMVLVRALGTSDMIGLQSTVANDAAPPFLRAAQFFVGLCANDIASAAERERREAGKALAEYAALASDEIGRIFAPTELGGAPAPFRPTDLSFDEAARSVLVVLGRSLV